MIGLADSDSARMTAVVFQTATHYRGKRMMGRRLHSHYLTLLLLAVVTLGYGQQVWACPMMLSPTPVPMRCPMMGHGALMPCSGASLSRGISCGMTSACGWVPAGPAARVAGIEVRNAHAVAPSATAWIATSPVATHRRPPPQGPPSIAIVPSAGRDTYLSTLRLRL